MSFAFFAKLVRRHISVLPGTCVLRHPSIICREFDVSMPHLHLFPFHVVLSDFFFSLISLDHGLWLSESAAFCKLMGIFCSNSWPIFQCVHSGKGTLVFSCLSS